VIEKGKELGEKGLLATITPIRPASTTSDNVGGVGFLSCLVFLSLLGRWDGPGGWARELKRAGNWFQKLVLDYHLTSPVLLCLLAGKVMATKENHAQRKMTPTPPCRSTTTIQEDIAILVRLLIHQFARPEWVYYVMDTMVGKYCTAKIPERSGDWNKSGGSEGGGGMGLEEGIRSF